jgi:cold shock CspA family protein
MALGTVKSVQPAFRTGYIRPDDGGADVFFTDQVISGSWSQYFQGAPVTFERKPGTNDAASVSAR